MAPLALAGAPLIDALPWARSAVAVAAGLWVAMLALRLWRLPVTAAGQTTVGARGVFVTTLLNPKALIFGLVLLPDPSATLLNLANFATQVVVVAALWIGLGAGLGRTGGAPAPALPILRRAASVWLAGLAVVLVLRGAGLA